MMNNPNTSRKYMYGELNKEIQKTNFVGVPTDTLDIVVDNENGTISGNVKFDPFLGETDNSAYPGNLGRRNFEDILNLIKKVDAEINRARVAEGGLRSSIDAESSERTLVDEQLNKSIKGLKSALDELSEKLVAEISRSQSVDTATTSALEKLKASSALSIKEVGNLLTTEIDRSTKVDEEVSDRLVETENELSLVKGSLEEALATLKETNESLSSLIKKEREDRISEDSRLSDSIDATTTNLSDEILRATTTEQTIINEVNKLNETVVTSVGELNSVCDAISDRITKEENRATTQEALLNLKLGTVEKESKDRDTELSIGISDLKSELETTENELKELIVSSGASSDLKYDTLANEDARLDKSIKSEESRARKAESDLSDAIEKEVAERTLADRSIIGRLDTVDSSISDEVTRATIAESKLGERIDVVSSLSKKYKNDVIEITDLLSDRIDEEKADRESGDIALSHEISTLGKKVESDIKAEEHRAITAEGELLDEIKSTRVSFYNSLTRETNRAVTAETTLTEDLKSTSETFATKLNEEADVRDKTDKELEQKIEDAIVEVKLYADRRDDDTLYDDTEIKQDLLKLREDVDKSAKIDVVYTKSELDRMLNDLYGDIIGRVVGVEETSHTHTNISVLDDINEDRVGTWDRAEASAISTAQEYTDNAVEKISSTISSIEQDYKNQDTILNERIDATLQAAKEYADANDEDTKYDDLEVRELITTLDSNKADKSSVYTKEETDATIKEVVDAIPEVDFTGYATEQFVLDNIPNVESFISEIPEEYITEEELAKKGYLVSDNLSHLETKSDATSKLKEAKDYTDTQVKLLLGEGVDTAYDSFKEIQELLKADDVATEALVKSVNKNTSDIQDLSSTKADKGDIIDAYSKSEIDAKGFLTTIPNEYITETELNEELEKRNYLTEHQDISGKADKVHTHSYNDLTDKPTIPTLDGYATEDWVEDKGYLTEIPTSVYVLDYQFGDKQPVSQHVEEFINKFIDGENVVLYVNVGNIYYPATVGKSDSEEEIRIYYTTPWRGSTMLFGDSSKEYPITYAFTYMIGLTFDSQTETWLSIDKGRYPVRVIETGQLPSFVDDRIPKNVSSFANDAGYLTEHQDISGKADVSELNALGDRVNDLSVVVDGKASATHTHSISEVTDYVAPDLSPYALEEDIPTNVSELNNDVGYLTEHQSLEAYATTESVTSAINENNALIEDDIKAVDTKLDNTKSELVQEIDALKSISLIIGGTAPVEE